MSTFNILLIQYEAKYRSFEATRYSIIRAFLILQVNANPGFVTTGDVLDIFYDENTKQRQSQNIVLYRVSRFVIRGNS